MLAPSIFEDNFVDSFFDDAFRFPFNTLQKSKVPGMNVDVQEFDDRFIMDIELPGYAKEDIQADLKDGYLNVSANRTDKKEEKDEEGRYIRRERYCGQCQRSFFVGENITQENFQGAGNGSNNHSRRFLGTICPMRAYAGRICVFLTFLSDYSILYLYDCKRG